jgi:hypothetical protein
VLHLRHVAHAPEDPVRNARGTAGATRNLVCCILGDLDVEDSCRAPDDRPELLRLVVLQPEGHAEAVA